MGAQTLQHEGENWILFISREGRTQTAETKFLRSVAEDALYFHITIGGIRETIFKIQGKIVVGYRGIVQRF